MPDEKSPPEQSGHSTPWLDGDVEGTVARLREVRDAGGNIYAIAIGMVEGLHLAVPADQAVRLSKVVFQALDQVTATPAGGETA